MEGKEKTSKCALANQVKTQYSMTIPNMPVG